MGIEEWVRYPPQARRVRNTRERLRREQIHSSFNQIWDRKVM